MTMPTLIQNYKKHVWVNQLKKSTSVISQGLQKAMADEGVTSLNQLSNEIFGSRRCDNAKNVLKIFQLLKIDGAYGAYCHEYDDGSLYNGQSFDILYEYTNGVYFDGDGYYLQDGTLFGISSFGALNCTNNTNIWGTLWLDVNGDKKGPNAKGRDIFYFYVLDTGVLLPIHSKQFSCVDHEDTTVIDSNKNWKENSSCSVEKGKFDGCAARIIEEGWKMNY